jgi:hypothetical protein
MTDSLCDALGIRLIEADYVRGGAIRRARLPQPSQSEEGKILMEKATTNQAG